MDTRLLLAANKQIARILTMQQKATPKLPADVTVSKVDSRPTRWDSAVIFPEDADEFFAWRFGGIRRGTPEFAAYEATLPKDRLTIGFEIKWRKSVEELEMQNRARAEAAEDSRPRLEAWKRLVEAGVVPSLEEVDAEVLRHEKEMADPGPDAAQAVGHEQVAAQPEPGDV